MANKKINDLATTGSVTANMQYETDINGTTANRVTSNQIGDYVNTTQTYSGLNTTNKTMIGNANNVFIYSSSAGMITGGAITDAGGGNIDTAAGNGLFRTTDEHAGILVEFTWPQLLAQAIPTNTARYVGVEYNAGIPQIILKTTDLWNRHTEFRLGSVVNENGTLYILNNPWQEVNADGHMIERFFETLPFQRADRIGGLFIDETGIRNITLSAGELYDLSNEFIITAKDTSIASTFDTYLGLNLEASGQTQWDNQNYNNGGVLTALGVSKWGILWWYIEANDSLVMVYGTDQYNNISAADAVGIPSVIPLRIKVQGKLLGRTLFQKAASTGTFQSAFTTSFPGVDVSNGEVPVGMRYTGRVNGGIISINADPTKFDITAGYGYLIDNSNPDNVIKTKVEWTAKTAVTTTFLTTSAGTFLGINLSGNVVQQITDFSPDDLANNIIRCGRLGHFNRTTVTGVFNYPYHYLSCDLDWAIDITQKGTVNIKGNEFSENGTNLKLDKTEGLSHRIGANFETDANDPNVPRTPSVAQISFFRAYRDSGGGTTLSSSTTDLNPTQWDNDSGTLQAVPSNDYTIQEVILFPNNLLYTVMIIYGQEVYNTFLEGEAALINYRAEIESDIEGASVRTLILMREDVINLTAAIAGGTAKIVNITDGGTVGGAGATTYLALTDTPNVYTTATALIHVNATTNGLEESGVLTSGSTLFPDIVRALGPNGLRLQDDAGLLGIYIEDGGQVGIGNYFATNVVNYTLQVRDSVVENYSTARINNSANRATFTIAGDGSLDSGNVGANLHLRDYSNSSDFEMWFYGIATPKRIEHKIETVTKMILDDTGQLELIGNASGSNVNTLYLRNNATSLNNNSVSLTFATNAASTTGMATIRCNQDGTTTADMYLGCWASGFGIREFVKLDSQFMRVGIGQSLMGSAVNSTLHVADNANESSPTIRCTNTDNRCSLYIVGSSTGDSSTISGRFILLDSDNNSNTTILWNSAAATRQIEMIIDGSGNFVFTENSELGIGVSVPSSALDVNGDIELGAPDIFYRGDPTTDGSWRSMRSGNDLVFQRRESSSWVTKSTISA